MSGASGTRMRPRLSLSKSKVTKSSAGGLGPANASLSRSHTVRLRKLATDSRAFQGTASTMALTWPAPTYIERSR
jgi:hypothetical protein